MERQYLYCAECGKYLREGEAYHSDALCDMYCSCRCYEAALHEELTEEEIAAARENEKELVAIEASVWQLSQDEDGRLYEQ